MLTLFSMYSMRFQNRTIAKQITVYTVKHYEINENTVSFFIDKNLVKDALIF